MGTSLLFALIFLMMASVGVIQPAAGQFSVVLRRRLITQPVAVAQLPAIGLGFPGANRLLRSNLFLERRGIPAFGTGLRLRYVCC